MPEIKTRSKELNKVKTLDRNALAAQRMKAAYVHTKETARVVKKREDEQGSAESKATEQISHSGERLTYSAVSTVNAQGKKAAVQTKQNSEKAKADIRSRERTRAASEIRTKADTMQGAAEVKTADAKKAIVRTKPGEIKKNESAAQIKTAQQTIMKKTVAKKSEEKLRSTQTAKAAKKAEEKVQAAAKAAAKFIKTSAAATKAMALAVFAGGWLLLLLAVIVVLFGAIGSIFTVDVDKAPVSDEVKAYAEIIQIYALEQGIPEFSEIIMAVMMQESGGRGSDPMQASESAFNTEYPNTPGGITDPEYSVYVGVQTFADVLAQAGVADIEDTERLYIALQAYNFGPGYISYAYNNGGHSQLVAMAFSEMMAQRMGWESYGDPYYVQNVMRYLSEE